MITYNLYDFGLPFRLLPLRGLAVYFFCVYLSSLMPVPCGNLSCHGLPNQKKSEEKEKNGLQNLFLGGGGWKHPPTTQSRSTAVSLITHSVLWHSMTTTKSGLLFAFGFSAFIVGRSIEHSQIYFNELNVSSFQQKTKSSQIHSTRLAGV